MSTATIRQPKAADFRELRKAAEQQVREIREKLRGLEALIASLSAAAKTQVPRDGQAERAGDTLKATEDLRVSSGRLSSAKIAKAFGISMNQLAHWLGRSRQALAKTPDADSLQGQLGYFERVARLRAVVPGERFLKWLRMPNGQFDGKSPLQILATDDRNLVAELVADMLTGAAL